MSETNILDKVIKAQEDQKKIELNPQELVNFLLSDLASRQKEVIKARYGLDRTEPETLEAIGKRLEITRERVRQIEKNALRKALEISGVEEKLADLVSLVTKHIHKGGYMRLENALLNELLENSKDFEIDSNCLRFIFSKFLVEHIEPVMVVHTENAWQMKNKDLSHYESVVEGVKNILNKKNEPMHLDEIMGDLEKELAESKIKELEQELEDWKEVIHSYLEVSKHFKKNLFDRWGLKEWRSVNPKRMRDKIYLVLGKYREPLHYKTIADKINEEKFDSKVAHPATIHNELILDDRFVLIGRGIYALKEWGYKPGVISQVVKEVLTEAGGPLIKDEIIKEVLKRRIVKEGSINLTLADKDTFERLADGRYALKA